jgi:hypothetical protein
MLVFAMKSFSKRSFVWLACLPGLLLPACGDSGKCRYKPTPIFGADLPYVVKYNFEVQGQQSLESVLLENQVLLEVYQDVCQSTRQEYRFNVAGDRSAYPDSLWMKEASRQLVFLSTMSEKQLPLKAWADVIEQNRSNMRLGVPLEIDQGISVQVDRILSPEKSTLVLVFAQQ